MYTIYCFTGIAIIEFLAGGGVISVEIREHKVGGLSAKTSEGTPRFTETLLSPPSLRFIFS